MDNQDNPPKRRAQKGDRIYTKGNGVVKAGYGIVSEILNLEYGRYLEIRMDSPTPYPLKVPSNSLEGKPSKDKRFFFADDWANIKDAFSSSELYTK